MGSAAFIALQWLAIAFLLLMLYFALFERGLPYRVGRPPADPLDAEAFRLTLSALAGASLHCGSRVEVLTNGDAFYEGELEAIRTARDSVHLEAYIFQPGEVTRRFLAAMAERARAGVAVHVVLDAVGCFLTTRGYLAPLIDAGGHIEFYHPIRWYNLPRINNRTHRELLIIDGKVGFLGGAGFADHWLRRHGHGPRKKPRWRDTMFRIEGDIVRAMQSVFAENWLESSGRILFDSRYFPSADVKGPTEGMIVGSSPTFGGSTRNRMLYQTLLAAAQRSIHITTPYFLPDRSARSELVRAIRERGVKVVILTPGRHADHLLTRRSSRRLYGDLLRAGASIYEYQPSMLHAKVLIVDGTWSVVGSTNFDNRSFGLNDEVNLAAYCPELATRLEEDFARDLAQSRQVNYQTWRRRPFFERGHELLGWLLERQQ
ncbi:MAG: cardiolipin synthase B [Acidobacteria bacterium]|nr:MAG: cardiolipin synthase B [Acidobacteriota bacterium]